MNFVFSNRFYVTWLKTIKWILEFPTVSMSIDHKQLNEFWIFQPFLCHLIKNNWINFRFSNRFYVTWLKTIEWILDFPTVSMSLELKTIWFRDAFKIAIGVTINCILKYFLVNSLHYSVYSFFPISRVMPEFLKDCCITEFRTISTNSPKY